MAALSEHCTTDERSINVSDQAKVALSGRIRPAQPRPGLDFETWATHSSQVHFRQPPLAWRL
jgi:hypothetical protein